MAYIANNRMHNVCCFFSRLAISHYIYSYQYELFDSLVSSVADVTYIKHTTCTNVGDVCYLCVCVCVCLPPLYSLQNAHSANCTGENVNCLDSCLPYHMASSFVVIIILMPNIWSVCSRRVQNMHAYHLFIIIRAVAWVQLYCLFA